MRPPQPPFTGPDVVYTVLDASPHNVVAVNSDGVIGYVNARTLRTFGYDEAELLGEPVEILMPGELTHRHEQHRKTFVTEPRARPMGIGRELTGRHKHGHLIPVEISLTPVDTADGIWVIAAIADVSSRRVIEARLQSMSRAYLTQARMNQAIVRAEGAPDLFAETCRLAVEEGGYLGAWVAVGGPGFSVESVATAGELDDFVEQLHVTTDPADPRGHDPTALALREGRSCYSADFGSDPATAPWHGLAATFGIHASASLPLRRGGETVAVLTLWSAQPRIFDEQMRSLLEGLAENVSFALDGFDAAARLKQVAAQRSELLRRLVAAQEEERARIAADVHDDSVQALAALGLRLGLLGRKVAESAPELVASVEQLQETVGAVGSGLRHLLFNLEPDDPDASLVEMVEEAAEHTFEGSDVRWSVQVAAGPATSGAGPQDERDLRLSDVARVQAARVVKEALINVRKHAGASVVRVVLRPVAGGVEIAVSDDGVGGDTEDLSPAPGHRGLTTMRDRAEIAGGWCRIEQGHAGTTLRFWMPCVNPAVTAT